MEFYIGLISGTSIDGIDAALVNFSATGSHSLAAYHYSPWPPEMVERLRFLSVPGQGTIEELGVLDAEVADAFALATDALLRKAGIAPQDINAIGSHGQTIRHLPDQPRPFTLQIGDPNRIAQQTGIPVVADFRRRDMAAGGQGAPMVPAYHTAVFSKPGEPRVVVNIGGIANVTILPSDEDMAVSGFDTGPGNTLLNAWTREHLGREFDSDGAWAASGRVDHSILETMLADPYFRASVPKTTGPEYFNRRWIGEKLGPSNLSPQDIQATLTALTAHSIAQSIELHAPTSKKLIVCGGGVHNAALMRHLETRLPNINVESSSRYGIDPDQVEAIAFAWLARRTLHGLSGNLPSVTGASHPVVLGGIYPGKALPAGLIRRDYPRHERDSSNQHTVAPQASRDHEHD